MIPRRLPRLPRFSTALEPLEPRITPATHLWTGPLSGGLWSNPDNWSGGVPATAEAGGTIVEFDGGVTSTNDLAGLVLDQIHFAAGGNTILGAPDIILGLRGSKTSTAILNDAGENTLAQPAQIYSPSADSAIVRITAGQLTLQSPVLDHPLHVFTTSVHEVLRLEGAAFIKFGLTMDSGTLELAADHDPTGYYATIGARDGAPDSAVIRLLKDDQFSSLSSVTVFPNALFDLNGHDTSLGYLGLGTADLSAAVVSTGAGTLSVVSISTSVMQTSTIPNAVGGAVGATISGFLELTGGGSIQVWDGSAAVDLTIGADLVGRSSLDKYGPGALEFQGSGGSGDFSVREGELYLNSPGENNAIRGNLHVGGGYFGYQAFVHWKRPNQIADSSTIEVSARGVVSITEPETITNLTFDSSQYTGGIVYADVPLTLLGDLSFTAYVRDAGLSIFSGSLYLPAGTHKIHVPFETSYTSGQFSIDTLEGPGSLLKDGAGTLALNFRSSSFDGDFVIAEGTVDFTSSFNPFTGKLVLGDGVGASQSASLRFDPATNAALADTVSLTVRGDGLFDFRGFSSRLAGLTVERGGTVLLGEGTLTTENLALSSGSLLTIEPGGLLQATGSVSVGGRLNLPSFDLPGSTGKVILVDNAGLSPIAGTFAGLPEGGVIGTPHGLFRISYHGGDGNDLELTATDASTIVKISPNGRTATYTDVDGDLVTIRTTKGAFRPEFFDFGTPAGGLLNGFQLQHLNLDQLVDAAVTFTARRTVLGGDGHVNVGFIESFYPLASLTLPGDLAHVLIGESGGPGPGLGRLTVDSLGKLGDATLRPGTPFADDNFIDGIRSLVVKGDFQGVELALGEAGAVTIGGSLIGSLEAGPARISATSLQKITIAGSVVSLRDQNVAGISTTEGNLGSVVIGGAIYGSASITSAGRLGSVLVKDAIRHAFTYNESDPVLPSIISAVGDATGTGRGVDLAIGNITVGRGGAEYLDIRAGYNALGEAVNGDASIGKIRINGYFGRNTVFAGVAPGLDGILGTSDDYAITSALNRFSSIASLIVRQNAFGEGPNRPFVVEAEQITFVQVEGHTLKLKPGPHSPEDNFTDPFLPPNSPWSAFTSIRELSF